MIKSILNILIFLIIGIAIMLLFGVIYWHISSTPSIEVAFYIGLFAISICVPFYLYFRAKKYPFESQQDFAKAETIVIPIIKICEIACCAFIGLWWIFPKDVSVFYFATFCLVLFYAYLFNELPTKGFSITKTEYFKKRQLPALSVATIGYCIGLIIKKI